MLPRMRRRSGVSAVPVASLSKPCRAYPAKASGSPAPAMRMSRARQVHGAADVLLQLDELLLVGRDLVAAGEEGQRPDHDAEP